MSGQRKRRADAELNRARIIASARRIYREQGPGASLEAIAADARVGSATLYRHFPTRSDLRTAVLTARMAEVEEVLSAVELEPDPWVAVASYLRHLAAEPDHTFLDALVTPPATTTEVTGYRERIRARVDALLARADAAGLLRAAYTVDDMNVFLFAHAKAVSSPYVDTAAGDRLLADYLAGIHGPGTPADRVG
ncbi:MAG: transcriptional regulator, TetR family [Blastococcus sp.]|nr:transcriptional regulator, TetR family [Blastococcus sp.]